MRKILAVIAALAISSALAAIDAADTPSFLIVLGDDIGWADFRYNNGTAATPNIDAWANRQGSIILQDFHSGGTVCSPTRATVLTGRNHFRDCVDFVYGCSDMTECVPKFEFAPQDTFTIADAARASGLGVESFFQGKWHLGSFYNDSELYGGITSSPISHGFDHMNATVEVAPTATLNYQCNEEWNEHVDYGHYGKPTHCNGGANPGGPDLPKGCCFNYWWNDEQAEHGVTNLTRPTPIDDSEYLTDSFERFLEKRDGAPFVAQISFHNCHIPFIGTTQARADCAANKTCKPPVGEPYTDTELDYYACITELDAAVGRVLNALETHGYYENTLVTMTTDNGPEKNCPPLGICKGTEHRPEEGPGSAGPLRGRKRDIYEGGHRVNSLLSWPKVVKAPAGTESWDLLVSMDIMATLMEVYGVERPKEQRHWAFDGVSMMPLLTGQGMPPNRTVGWMFDTATIDPVHGYGLRKGDWKLVVGSKSCTQDVCRQPQLYNLAEDLGERNDLSKQMPEMLQELMGEFQTWHASIINSMQNESMCSGSPSPGPGPEPSPYAPSSACEWRNSTGLTGKSMVSYLVSTQEECCGACSATEGCAAADFTSMGQAVVKTEKQGSTNVQVNVRAPEGQRYCHLKKDLVFAPRADGSIACVPSKQ